MLQSSDAYRCKIASMLVQAYRAADAIADKFGFYDLSGRLIEIMRLAAEKSGDLLATAVVGYVRAETFFASGQLARGRRLLEQAANNVSPGVSKHAAADHGALHMRAAVIAARAGLSEYAEDHLTEARNAASRLMERIYSGTAFGSASVRIHDVSVALDLAVPEMALRAAAGWRPPDNVPAERKSHYYIDIGRAQSQIECPEAALEAFRVAYTIAPEHVRAHPQVIETLTELKRSGALAVTEVRRFIVRSGILMPSS